MTRQKRVERAENLCKGGIVTISHGVKVCGGRAEGQQGLKDSIREGRTSELKDLMGSKDYMSHSSSLSREDKSGGP